MEQIDDIGSPRSAVIRRDNNLGQIDNCEIAHFTIIVSRNDVIRLYAN